MARSNGKKAAGGRPGASRITPTPCKVLKGDRFCEPLNKVWLLDAAGQVTKRWAACSCGQRFAPREVPKDLPESVQAFLAERPAPSDRLDETGVAAAVEGMWPVEEEASWARIGVVPVGQQVLHEPTAALDPTAPSVTELCDRLLHTQFEAEGIGLAANQVGAGVRALVHNLPRVAPSLLLNPTLLEGHGEWEYEEGCLSLHLDGTWGKVIRPKVIVVHAELADGTELVTEADELFARVLQHEIDHLDGIEYVQRLTGAEARRVYEVMAEAGIDTARWLPARPY